MSGGADRVKRTLVRLLQGIGPLRGLSWRLGRTVYTLARGESLIDDMAINGELDLLRQVIATRDAGRPFIAFDIGANFGDWSAAALTLLKPDDLIQAFEPTPTTRQRLAQRFASAPNVRISDHALSDRSGALPLMIRSETGGTNSLVFDPQEAGAGGVVRVPVTTFDAFAAEAGVAHIDMVKCDAEGADLAILRGASGLLSAGQIDFLQFEYNHAWVGSRSFLKDVFDLIADMEYALARVVPGQVEVIAAWSPELERFFHSNYVLVRRPMLGRLRHVVGRVDRSNVFSAG